MKVHIIQNAKILNLVSGGLSTAVLNERHCRIVTTPASYSGSPSFDSRSQLPAVLFQVLLVLLSPSIELRDSPLKLGHVRFLPNTFQFIIIHLSSYYRRYECQLLKSVDKLTTNRELFWFTSVTPLELWTRHTVLYHICFRASHHKLSILT
jgi:hypothetical protein